jgi:hypothetical protein
VKQQITRFTLDKLQANLERTKLERPFVIRCSRNTAVKIAEVYDTTWLPEAKGKQAVGPFLIIA